MNPAVLALSAVLALVPASCGAQPAPTAHASAEGAETVRVVRVTDGDTFTVDSGAKIRVLGIDSCEAKTPAGPAATSEAKTLLLGKTVTLTAEPGHDRDRYGRLLRYVALPDGQDYGRTMVAERHTGVYSKKNDASPRYVAWLRAADTDGRDCER